MDEEHTLTAADIEEYYNKRNLLWPGIDQAALWAMTELGEAAEAALMISKEGWVRNDPDKERDVWGPDRFAEELGDVIMMCVVAGLGIGKDPIAALKQKMKRKVEENV